MQYQRDFWEWSEMIARLATVGNRLRKAWYSGRVTTREREREGGSERIPRKVYTMYNTRSSKAWSRGRWSSKGRVEKNLIFPRIILFGNNGFTSRIASCPAILVLSCSLSFSSSFPPLLSSLLRSVTRERLGGQESAKARWSERERETGREENGSPTRRQRKKSRNSKSWIVVTERHSSWYTGCDYIFPSFRLN